MGVRREYMFQTRDEEARACIILITHGISSGTNTHSEKQVRITVENEDAEGIQPLPHLLCLLLSRQSLQLSGTFVVDCFGLQEEAEGGGCPGQSRLQPEDVPPTAERDDDAADERACRCQ